jgi:hypothetical protein
VRYETGNPYGCKQSLAPRRKLPGPAPVLRPGVPRQQALTEATAARQGLVLRMRRAACPWEFD